MDHENWVCLNAAVADLALIHRSLEVGPEHGSVDDDVTSVNEEAVECDSEPLTEAPVEASTGLGKPAEERHSSAPEDHAWASVAGDVALAAYAVVALAAYAVVLAAYAGEVVGTKVATKVADFGNSTEVATEHLCSVLLPK